MRNRAGILLGAAGAVLILLVIVLLWSLGGTPQRETRRTHRVRAPRQRPVTARRPLPPPARTTAPARTTGSAVLPPEVTTPAATPDAATPGVAESPARGPAPVPAPGTHMAPAMIPASITHETDPVRKAQLMRMHELAVARSRASRLRRRARLLSNTLAAAKQQKSWDADRIQKAEKDLTELGSAIKLAEKNAKIAEQRAGVTK